MEEKRTGEIWPAVMKMPGGSRIKPSKGGQDMEEERKAVRPSEKETRSPVIQVRRLYKIYRVGETKVHALNGVDFTMYKGEFCAIVGPSGSGKSTLLNMLAGLEKPTKGEIVIAGKHIEKMKEDQLVAFRRERVGFIFQSYNLLGTMNAIENVALPLAFRGIGKKERIRKAQKYLKLVGLSHVSDHMPNQMSGGQQQRVGIARALAVKPKIIFADEPTGNLDSKTTMEVLKLMQKIVREQNQTLVMVTHDDHLATYADRIFHIIDGKIVKIETMDHSSQEAVGETRPDEEKTGPPDDGEENLEAGEKQEKQPDSTGEEKKNREDRT